MSRYAKSPRFAVTARESLDQSLSARGVSARTPIRAARRTFWSIGQLLDVLRPQGVEPADLAPFVADDDLGQDRARERQGALDARRATSALSAIWLKASPTAWAKAA